MLTGSPMREVLEHYRPEIDASDVLSRLGLTERSYFLVSAHREENVDSPDRLRMLLDCLVAVRSTWQMPVYVSTHPRTRQRLEALPDWTEPEGLVFLEPLGFHDYNRLQLSAACVLSDSGTIAEESTITGFPAVTLRDAIERPEALDTGGIMMTGLNWQDTVRAVRMVMADHRTRSTSSTLAPDEYLISDTSQRVTKFVMSTAGRHPTSSSIR